MARKFNYYVPRPESNGQVISCLLSKKTDTTNRIQYYNEFYQRKEQNLNLQYGIKYPIEHNTCSFIINHVTDSFFDEWTITTGYKIVFDGLSTLHYKSDDLTIEHIENGMNYKCPRKSTSDYTLFYQRRE